MIKLQKLVSEVRDVVTRHCQLNIAEAKRGLVDRCSEWGRRILGNAGEVMPDSEASGQLNAMLCGAQMLTPDRKMLPDRSEAGQELLGTPR